MCTDAQRYITYGSMRPAPNNISNTAGSYHRQGVAWRTSTFATCEPAPRSERRRAKSKASEAPAEEEEVDQLAMDEVPAEELPETLQEEVPSVIGM